MKRLLILSTLIFVGTLGWRVGSAMSTDAMGIAVGVVFGVLASIPAALLMLAAGRRNEQRQEWDGERARGRNGQQQPQRGQGQFGNFPPVVIMTPPSVPMAQSQANQYASYYGGQGNGQFGGYLPQPNGMALPGPYGEQGVSQRQFRVVGEDEEWVEEW